MILRIYHMNSQNFISNVYDFANDSDSGWKILATDSTIFVLNAEVCMNNSVICSGLLAIDYSGNIVYTNIIDSMQVAFLDNLFVDGDKVYLSLISNSPLPENYVTLFQFDLNGNLINERKFEHFGKLYLPLGITKSADTELILSLKVENVMPTKDTCIFMMLDTNLNTVNSIVKTEPFANCNSSILKPSEKGKFIYAQVPGYLDDVHGYVTKIDTNGTEIWNYELPKTYAPRIDVVSDTSGICYAIWQKNYYVSWDTFNYPPVLIKLDKNGVKLWEYPFYSQLGLFLNNIFIAKNGDVIGCGVDDDMTENTPSYDNSGAWIFRMSPDGVLKWRRSIADLTLSNIDAERLIDGTELPNGDLVFCGDIGYLEPPYSTGGSDIWVIRTDSMGCFSPNCGDIQLVTSSKDIESKNAEIQLRPNPARDFISFSSNMSNFQIQKVDIFDISGKFIFSEKLNFFINEINILSLSNGFYVAKIYLSNNKVVAKKFIKL